jgi:hypothetical protein
MPSASQIKRAKLQGRQAAGVIGPESIHVYNPYDPDAELELYEAWQDEFDKTSDVRSEMIHWGV